MQYLLRLLRDILVLLTGISKKQDELGKQNERLAFVNRQIIRRLNRIEDIVSANQDKLDAVAAQLDVAATGLAADIQALKDQIAAGTPPEQLDFTALDARAQALSDLDAQNPTV